MTSKAENRKKHIVIEAPDIMLLDEWRIFTSVKDTQDAVDQIVEMIDKSSQYTNDPIPFSIFMFTDGNKDVSTLCLAVTEKSVEEAQA
jgi:hypothetical protein